MNMDELVKKLRKPKQAKQAAAVKAEAAQNAPKRLTDYLPLLVGASVALLLLLTFVFIMNAKNRAENITAALSPDQLRGLSADAQFNPNTGVKYVQVQEGQDRNVAVANLGSTIPVISRFNYRTLTKANYQVIGAAPWALTSNIAANLNDPDLLRYLLGNDELIKAFLARPEVADLTTDPQALYHFINDQNAMAEFFDSDAVKQVLANEKALQAIAGSRLMSYLIISKAVKYYRDRPEQAAQLIRQNPYLNELRENPFVRRAVTVNPYLKNIAPTLLK